MAVRSLLGDEVIPIEGVALASARAGIKKNGSPDLVLIRYPAGSTTVGVFTRNSFAAAPVEVCRDRLSRGNPQALIINSGNANCAVGERGRVDAESVCSAVAKLLEIDADEVLPFSTGVIGERLPVDRIVQHLPELTGNLRVAGWQDAAMGIMTTDTRPKLLSTRIMLDGGIINLTGICKGSGMIRPDMATLLVFLATDAVIERALLQSALEYAVAASFNRVTIDSDTSTNDSCVLTATQTSGLSVNVQDGSYDQFAAGLRNHCQELAREIVRDAEGATKFVQVRVEGGRSNDESLAVAYSVADSPLVKTALFASDANWGRIVMAIGKTGIDGLDPSLVDVYLGEVRIVEAGGRDPSYTEEKGTAEVAREEVSIRICLGRGDCTETVWTCDLSHDYVSINADYRS